MIYGAGEAGKNYKRIDMNFGEFFQDDSTGLGSMNRLATFIAIWVLATGFLAILFFCVTATGTDLREYLGALTTLGIIIAGLGGFNYAAARAAGAYTEVRVAQADKMAKRKR